MASAMNQRERSILSVACYGHFLSHFNMLVFPAVLLPLTAVYGMAMTEVLALSFWMYLLFGITALPWGIAADKFGPKPLLVTFYLGAGACGLLAAFNVNNPTIFALGLTGIGLFSGIYHPAGLGWISREVKNTSRGMAYNGMFGNLGLAIAPLAAGSINYFLGVKAVYIMLAVLNLLGLVYIFMVKEQGKEALREDTKKHIDTNGTIIPFLFLLLAMTLGGVVYRGTSVTLPAFLELKSSGVHHYIAELTGGLGSTNVNATVLASFIYFVGILAQYIGGKIGERVDLRLGYLMFHLLTIPAAIMMANSSDMALFFWALMHGFFLLGMQPIENTLVARLTPPKIRSSAYGLKFVFTFGVGALSLRLVNWVKIEWSFESVYIALALVSVVLCFAIVGLAWSTKNKQLS